MKKFIHTSASILLTLLLVLAIHGNLQAQSFPVGVLPGGKTIVITYEVDVNANACPTGTIPSPLNISNQSNVSGSNFATVQTDDPDIAGASNPTLTPFSTLTLGNLVFQDNNRNGIFDAGDAGIDGIILNLYLDNGDGVLTVADGAALGITATVGGGLYSFTVCPGTYIVEVAASNFTMGGALYNGGAPLVSSPVGGAPDPDNDVNNDDNGDPLPGFGVASFAITLDYGTEPINDGDMDANTNLTLDFGFKTPTSITINDVTMNEGTGGSTTEFNFTVTRNDNSEAFDLTVNTVAGTAVSPSDYVAITNGTVNFTAGGNMTATVTVLVNHENMVEENETFTVVLSGAPAGVILADDSGLGTITNDDAAVVTLTPLGDVTLDEGNAGNTPYVFTATLDNPVQGGFNLTYTTNDGTATVADLDYVDNDGTLMFSGTANENYNITVLVIGDNKVEANETFTVALGAISGAPAGVTTSGSPQTGTIMNDDAASVNIAGNVSQSEAITPMPFSITLSNPVDVPVTVTFSSSSGTATVFNDYISLTGNSVLFPANSTTPQTLNAIIFNDNVVEADETFTVFISNISASSRNVMTGAGGSAIGTILNDDTSELTLSGGIAQEEGNSGATLYLLTATLSNPVQGAFVANYTVNNGTATLPEDFLTVSGSLNFAGNAGESNQFFIVVNGDLDIENDEDFNVTINSLTGVINPGAVTIAGSPQVLIILNDEKDWGDAPDTYGTTDGANGARHALFPGGLTLGANFTADFDGQPGALANADSDDGVTIPSIIVTGTTATITVNASGPGLLNAWVDFNADGDWAEMDEQIFTDQGVVAGDNTLNFAVPAGAVIGSTFARFRLSTASGLSYTGLASDGEVEDYLVNILDNQFSIDNPIVTEGNAGTTTMTFTVTRTTNANDSSVDFDITGGTATGGTDYTTIPGATINFLAGGSLSETIEITVNGDLVVEDNETIIVTLSNPLNGGLGSNPGTGTIINDDSATITLSGGMAQNEGNAGTVIYTFMATLNEAVQGGFEVAYNTADGTATTADNDYIESNASLTFTGDIGESKLITVLVNGDTKVELDETFTLAFGALSLTSAVQAAAINQVGSPQSATIINDDTAIVSIDNDNSALESSSPQMFNVTLSNAVDVPVTVSFNTVDGTASAVDNDFIGITNQTVTFAAGSTTTQIVNVDVNIDFKLEEDESYNVTISNLMSGGRNVIIGTGLRTGTILNDDSAGILLQEGATQDEGNTGTTAYTFDVLLTNDVQGGLTVEYSTNDGTATTLNNDYQDNDGSLIFTGVAGEIKTITVLVNGDYFVEPNEHFTVSINAFSDIPLEILSNLTILNSPSTATINNDEVDWGDAPDSYGTTSAISGASHTTLFGYSLGASIDGDPDGLPGILADGDDTDAEGNDDDGVIIPSILISGTTENISVIASASGYLVGFIDFNGNGSFSDSEDLIFNNTPLNAGTNELTVSIPANATTGITYARFRYSYLPLSPSPTGPALGGEVEDYAIEIVNTQFSIDDPMVIEGDAGTVNLVYTVSRNVNVNACSVDFTITGGTATVADLDYQALAPSTLNFTAGGAFSQTITVVVNGDTKVELDETIEITLSNPVDAGILDGLGVGTIINDDAATITINNPSIVEGEAGTANLVFTIMLDNPVDVDVDIDAATLDGLATIADLDYVDFDETITILANTLSQSATVLINGDCTIEADEDFALELSNISASGRNVVFSGGGSSLEGTGTILNDDVLPEISCPANNTYNTDPGVCAATVTLDIASIVSSCGSTSLDFRYRSVDAVNSPTSPYTAYESSANNTVLLAKDRYEVEWRLTDESGEVVCSYFIEIFDVENPVITCPGTQTVNVDENCEAILPNYTSLALNDDNCGGNVVIQSPAPGTIVSQAGTELITLTVTDENGNSSSCTFNVTKIDAIAPVVVCQNDTVNFNGETTLLLTPEDLVEATDNCGLDTITATPSTVTISQLGQTIPVTLTVTDLSGNSSGCVSQVTIGGLPPGWSQNANGVNCQDGSNVEYEPSTQIWTMSSTGCYYASPFTSDELGYAQYTLCGNGQIVAQVTGISGSGLGWAGISMRETINAGSKKVQLTTNLSNFARREVRTTTGGQAFPQQFSSPNRYWLKLVRTGNQFVGFTSPNGVQWYQVMAVNVSMNSCIQLGLVLTNYNSSGTVNATFANVSTVGNSAPPSNIPNGLAQVTSYEYTVYPNPSNGEILVDLGDYANKEVRLELIDTYGRIVFVKDLDVAAGIESIDLNAFTNGIYFLKARSPGIPDNIKKVILLKN